MGIYPRLELEKRNRIHKLNQWNKEARNRFVCIDKLYLTELALQGTKEKRMVVLKM